MVRHLVLGCVGLTVSLAAFAQGAREGEFDTVVERYVAEGLRSNLSLQSQALEVERAAQALAAARARFLPEVSLQARYTRAEGGREFSIPLGTALNPVYSTLNELLAAQGQPAQFPQVSDVTVQFLREEEQDTRVVVRQPLYAPAIPAAVRAQRSLLDATSFNRMAVARALRRDITIAYVDWLKARSSVEIVAASRELLRENLRVNESLFSNGKITEDQVLRAKAELLAGRAAAARDRESREPGAQLLQLPAESTAAVGHRSLRAAADTDRRTGCARAIVVRGAQSPAGSGSRR